MEITDDLIDHLSNLAKLEFKGEERVAIQKDMEKILGFIDQLSELDTANISPLTYVNPEVDQLREDTSEITITQKEALKNAPKKDSDYFKVAKVLD